MESWTNFFVRAGIPQEISHKYAKTFTTNRITKEQLPEIDKATLVELGVTAIGDQLCILRRINIAKANILKSIESDDEPEHKKQVHRVQKSRITGPESSSSHSSISTASESRRGKPPPDRNEIYHVKMPAGNTNRTRQIMRKAEEMRQQGLAVRGTTGVRQGGRSVSPVDKTSLAARIVKKQSGEVSSSTDRHHSRHSQGSKISRISTSSIKKTISNRPSLSSRLSGASESPASHRSSGAREPSGIRIHVDSHSRQKNQTPQPKSRIAGRLQKATSRNVVVEYEEEDDYGMEEEVMEEEVVYEDDDEELYEAVMEETDDVLTIPSSVHQRITYSEAPRRGSSGNPRHSRTSGPSDSVFSRVSYNRR